MARQTIIEKVTALEAELDLLKAKRTEWLAIKEIEHGGNGGRNRTVFNIELVDKRIKEIEHSLEIFYNAEDLGVI